jgi:hypothetical protein
MQYGVAWHSARVHGCNSLKKNTDGAHFVQSFGKREGERTQKTSNKSKKNIEKKRKIVEKKCLQLTSFRTKHSFCVTF